MFATLRPSEKMLAALTQNQPEDLLAALEEGADPNFQRTKNTPLILAFANGNLECAQILVDKGADLNLPNGFGWMAIHEVCQRGLTDWAEKIIANPMNSTDRRDRQDATPLLIAVQAGHENIARLLVDTDCNVNAQNEQGVSPLMLAIERQSESLVSHMMAHKGDPSLKDGTGRSGFDRAENWPAGQKILGAASLSSTTASPEAAVAVDEKAQEAGVSGIQKRRRPV